MYSEDYYTADEARSMASRIATDKWKIERIEKNNARLKAIVQNLCNAFKDNTLNRVDIDRATREIASL